jgi:imidazolonepropionase-like amidohydrolase
VVTTSGETIDFSFKEGLDAKKAEAVREMLTHNLQILNRHGVRIAIGSDAFARPRNLKLSASTGLALLIS